MEKKKQSILFFKEDIERLEELHRFYNMNSIGEVSVNEVVRQAIKVLHNELKREGLI